MLIKKISFLIPILILTSLSIWAQRSESGELLKKKPLDGIYEPKLMEERRVLPYAPIREADVFWEKRVWRVIDTREKMNQTFSYPKAPLIELILGAAENASITVYHPSIDGHNEFDMPMTQGAVDSIIYTEDTVSSWDPETFEETLVPIKNEFNPESVKRFRIKEVWFFDENTSTMRVRILGIAPLQEVYDDNGNFRYERPMFWAYYPELRQILARHSVFNPINDASPLSWDDLFEMRYFSSYITKASNIRDERIQDYASGEQALWHSDKIKNEIMNFEHDLWSF